MQRPSSVSNELVLPSTATLDRGRASLISSLPHHGLGLAVAKAHLSDDIAPALSQASQSSRYYGFVTGGATPAASFADNLVTKADQNVGIHLPAESISTNVEDCALRMICELLRLEPDDWRHRIFTTGATASNVVGLACGRQSVVEAAAVASGAHVSVSEDGIFEAMRAAGLSRIQILSTVPHSSLRKAASIIGLGRASVEDVGREDAPHAFDLAKLEIALKRPGTASIVAVSCGEINTGFFATDFEDMKALRKLCDFHGAWLHVDAAFGLLARALPETPEYETILAGVAGLELADSIAGDAHKLLNVPYDCGILLSRHLSLGLDVFGNPNAAYLKPAASTESSKADAHSVPPPLNMGIENSRRFRALPVYATLAAYGREGYSEMLQRQIGLARGIARYIKESDHFVLLPSQPGVTIDQVMGRTYIIVLFRARDDVLNAALVQRINATRRLYVSGTQWGGKPAARFAVANWQVDVERDLEIAKEVLQSVL